MSSKLKRSRTKCLATRWSREEGLHRGRKNINLNKQKIHISAHVQSTHSSGWDDEVDGARPSHQHVQLPPAQEDRYVSRASGPAKPDEAPSRYNWTLAHHPLLASLPSLGNNRRQRILESPASFPLPMSCSAGRDPLGQTDPRAGRAMTPPQAPRMKESTMSSSQVRIKETWVAAGSPGLQTLP